MRYIARTGVARVEICGCFLLIPDRKASEYCEGVVPVKFLGAAVWGMLSNGKPIEDIYTFYRIMTRKEEDDVRRDVDAYLSSLCEKGYLIPVEDEE